MFRPELLDFREIAGDQRGRHQVGKQGDEHLFGRVAHMRRVVNHERLRMDALEQVGRRHIREVERRVLAHQHDVERGQLDPLRLAELEVTAFVVVDGKRANRRKNSAVQHGEPVGRVIGQRMAPCLRFEQQSKGGIAADIDAVDGVHLHRNVEPHNPSLFIRVL